MLKKLLCQIPNNANTYEIEIFCGYNPTLISYLHSIASKFVIITDDIIAELYGAQLCETLQNANLQTYLMSFPRGEHNKTRATKEILEDQLFKHTLGKDTCIIALGGGVVSDIAGYLAATYCRGLSLVIIPTTLLAMIDACIGGKNGVNTPYGKNMIGCIYQPKKIFINPMMLTTLSDKEFSNGMVEMIKHGLICDFTMFTCIEKQSEKILHRETLILEKLIYENCRIKIEIIEQDEKENGKRNLLNFGHTIGHAIEKLSDYSISHGEAVAIGIMVESYISTLLGFLDIKSLIRIKNVFILYNIPLKLPTNFSIKKILEVLKLDKKSINGVPRFVIIDAIGSAVEFDNHYCTSVETLLVEQALQWMNDDMYCDQRSYV